MLLISLLKVAIMVSPAFCLAVKHPILEVFRKYQYTVDATWCFFGLINPVIIHFVLCNCVSINFLLNELTYAGTHNPQLSNTCSLPLLIFFPK